MTTKHSFNCTSPLFRPLHLFVTAYVAEHYQSVGPAATHAGDNMLVGKDDLSHAGSSKCNRLLSASDKGHL
jgi:hypothetical protein